jgi:hypothetical protein
MVFNAHFNNISVSFIGGENGGQVVIPTAHYSDSPFFRHPFFRQAIAPTAHYSDSPLLQHLISPTTHFSVKNGQK